MKRRRRARIGLAAGALAGGVLAWAYVEWGSWTLPTPLTFPLPRPTWARILFFPGVIAGQFVNDVLLPDSLVFRTRLECCAVAGIAMTALVGAGLGWLLGRTWR